MLVGVAAVGLQWGRVRMNAEIGFDLRGHDSLSGASMGPRSDERGNVAPQRRHAMGLLLQWGRVRMNAEMSEILEDILTDIELQWGRVRMNAEIIFAAFDAPAHRLASMGPRSDERGNRYDPSDGLPNPAASMGPRSDERGNHSRRRLRPSRVSASMGPRSDERGNRPGRPASGRPGGRFNGAAFG